MSRTYIQGFQALPVRYNLLCRTFHWLYCKEHSVRERNAGKPAGRTLFVINVAPYYTEECLKQLFRDCGPVENVYFHQNPTSALPPEEKSKFFPVHPKIEGFKVAYVVFESANGLKAALKINWQEPYLLWDREHKRPSAVNRWKAEYDAKICNPEELQAEIDSFMKEYDKEAEKEEQKQKEMEGQPDEEGWVTVTKRGRNPGFARKESVAKNIMAKEGKKKAKKELKNFYSFQIRETKMNHLAQLRRKFEDDKKKIENLRSSRRFRPF